MQKVQVANQYYQQPAMGNCAPNLPIWYNINFLKRLQGRPQVRVMQNLSILLPESSSDAEEEMDTT